MIKLARLTKSCLSFVFIKVMNVSSMEHGGTKTFSNIMAKRWPSSMRGYQDIFSVAGAIEWQATERSEGASPSD